MRLTRWEVTFGTPRAALRTMEVLAPDAEAAAALVGGAVPGILVLHIEPLTPREAATPPARVSA